jgi:hypothetical protein
MFTIDLLKGQGMPLKTRPGGVAIVAATAVLPVLLAIGMFGIYLNNKVVLSLAERELVKSKEKIDQFSDALEQREVLMKEKMTYKNCLSEVADAIKKYTQWSPILTMVVENMPESVALTSLEVERNFIKKKVPKKDDPEQMEQVDVLVRVLHLRVRGAAQSDCDENVRLFQDHLRTSDVLGPRLENIRVSRDFETVQDQPVYSYEIICKFKPGL